MIGYLRGIVDQLLAEFCYLDVRGVGYRVFVPASTRDKLQVGTETKLYTYLNVREDALHLFGFITQEEHEVFLLLLTVTGVGPKMALAILSGMKPDGIRAAIGRNDLAALTAYPESVKRLQNESCWNCGIKLARSAYQQNCQPVQGH